jgi:hypothetical protein
MVAHVALTGRLPTGAHRSFASTCQPIDPLARLAEPATIDIVVPFVEKDLPALRSVVAGILTSVRNPIGNFFLVTPGNESSSAPRFVNPGAHKELQIILKDFPSLTVRFDREALGPELSRELLDGDQGPTGGWHLQQVLKLSLARASSQAGTLIVDADTVLLSSKTWLTEEGVQLLQFSEEFHQPYMDHFRGFFNVPKSLGVSFVTHYQLMQSDVVNEMFPDTESLLSWLRFGESDSSLKISEYESYGSFVLGRHPTRVKFGTWSNLWSPNLSLVSAMAKESKTTIPAMLPDYCSVSFHSHSQKDKIS